MTDNRSRRRRGTVDSEDAVEPTETAPTEIPQSPLATSNTYLARFSTDRPKHQIMLAATALGSSNRSEIVERAIDFYVTSPGGLQADVAAKRAEADEAIRKLSGG